MKISYLLNVNQVSYQVILASHNFFPLHTRYGKSFDWNPLVDVRGNFLDISKAFDKVWNDGLIYKLKPCGVENKFLNLIQNYLINRQQRVLLNGRTSKRTNILARIPQGSVLDPLLFLIYLTI